MVISSLRYENDLLKINMPLPDILNTGFKTDEPKLWAVDIPIEEIMKSLSDP